MSSTEVSPSTIYTSRLGTNQYRKQLDTVITACVAAKRNDVGTLKTLKVRGVSLTEGDYDLRTPLHVAASYGRIDAVRYLI